MSDADKLTVFYDGACPLCGREIAFYQRRRGAEELAWVDVSASPKDEVAPGLSKEAALARFHVQSTDGSLASGGAAFAQLWASLPGFRLLGRFLQAPPLAWLLERGYRFFLRIRPRLQALATPRERTEADRYPRWLLRELRSDHAGETGAVEIYRGILAVSGDAELRSFAAAHLKTEQRHLTLIEEVLPRRHRSLLLPLWRVAGFLTGAFPALFGSRAVYATIESVETFVDRHYSQQIERLEDENRETELQELLERCRLDEVHHRDEAQQALVRPCGPAARAWCWMVGSGSAAAVALARLG